MRRGELSMKSWPQCVALLSLLAGSKGHGLHARVLTTFHLHVRMCVYIYINISNIIHTTMLFCRLYASCLLPGRETFWEDCWANRWLARAWFPHIASHRTIYVSGDVWMVRGRIICNKYVVVVNVAKQTIKCVIHEQQSKCGSNAEASCWRLFNIIEWQWS